MPFGGGAGFVVLQQSEETGVEMEVETIAELELLLLFEEFDRAGNIAGTECGIDGGGEEGGVVNFRAVERRKRLFFEKIQHVQCCGEIFAEMRGFGAGGGCHVARGKIAGLPVKSGGGESQQFRVFAVETDQHQALGGFEVWLVHRGRAGEEGGAVAVDRNVTKRGKRAAADIKIDHF